MPLPYETELRVHDSPLPTHTFRSFEGSMVTAPIDCTGFLSKTGLNVVPPSSDFHTPPDAAPTYTVVLPLALCAATAATRPLICAEPMLRAPRPETTALSKAGGAASAGAGGAPGGDAAAGESARKMVRTTFAPGAGNRNASPSTSTFASARSMRKCARRGAPLGPESIANGIHTPPTCS